VDAAIDTVLTAAPLEPGTPVFNEDGDLNQQGPLRLWLRLIGTPRQECTTELAALIRISDNAANRRPAVSPTSQA
jgi:hypothetical protein